MDMMAGVAGAGGAAVAPDLQAVLVQLAATNPAWAGQLVPMLTGGGGGGGGKPSAKQVGLNMTAGAMTPETKKAVNVCKSCVGRAPTDQEIQFLIQSREMCRQARDFAGADMLRSELKNIGLEVFDKEKMWRAANGR